MNLYTCNICHHDNHAKRLHCETCGTIPKQYSVIGRDSILRLDGQSIPVVPARGCSRIEDRRGRRLYFRTIPADYFWSPESLENVSHSLDRKAK